MERTIEFTFTDGTKTSWIVAGDFQNDKIVNDIAANHYRFLTKKGNLVVVRIDTVKFYVIIGTK